MKVWDVQPPKHWKWTDQDFHINKLFSRSIDRAEVKEFEDYSVYQLLVFDKKQPTKSKIITEIIIK